MDSEQAKKPRRPWGRWSPQTWVDRSDTSRRIKSVGGSEVDCATHLGVRRSTFRYWFDDRSNHKGWIPKALEPKLDEYLNGLGHSSEVEPAVSDDSADGVASKRRNRPLIELHADIADVKIRELATCAFRRDNLQPQPEGDPISIDCHVNVQTIPTCRGVQIGVGQFSLFVDPDPGRRGVCRPPAMDSQVPGVKITRRGTPDGLHVVFENEGSPTGPLLLNGLAPAIPLGFYDQARAGEMLTIRMVASFDHDFVCVRAPSEGQSVSHSQSMNRKQVIYHLAKRANLGVLADDGYVTLVVQMLSIKRAEPE
ncbi:hypothetical protein [Methylocapsa sp. S129]|uniref:hypothetical protein n=1 Tax=Methylocapsa sp. S129 TaxID=1641869 RepID=UPI00131C1EA4|nr:hypothetical protein [Methylocapsa sp. S129]